MIHAPAVSTAPHPRIADAPHPAAHSHTTSYLEHGRLEHTASRRACQQPNAHLARAYSLGKHPTCPFAFAPERTRTALAPTVYSAFLTLSTETNDSGRRTCNAGHAPQRYLHGCARGRRARRHFVPEPSRACGADGVPRAAAPFEDRPTTLWRAGRAAEHKQVSGSTRVAAQRI